MAGFMKVLRREGDSNPRSRESRTTVFETAAFDHSAISPIILATFAMAYIPPWARPSLYFPCKNEEIYSKNSAYNKKSELFSCFTSILRISLLKNLLYQRLL